MEKTCPQVQSWCTDVCKHGLEVSFTAMSSTRLPFWEPRSAMSRSSGLHVVMLGDAGMNFPRVCTCSDVCHVWGRSEVSGGWGTRIRQGEEMCPRVAEEVVNFLNFGCMTCSYESGPRGREMCYLGIFAKWNYSKTSLSRTRQLLDISFQTIVF